MRHQPTFTYKGLTIVMSNPSRFDNQQLLSGYAGEWFNNECLRPEMNRFQCDIRTVDTMHEGLLPDTKAILILGENAMHKLLNTTHTIHQQRGSPSSYNRIPAICTYLPQDAHDIKASYELNANPWLRNQVHETEERETSETETEKNKGRTLRSNWRFWIQKDVKKVIRILNGETKNPHFDYSIYPPLEGVCQMLRKVKNEYLYLDIETDMEHNMFCVGINFSNSSTVYVLPVLRYNYQTAYTNIGTLFAALAIAMRDNTTVIHNSMFDLFVLACKYRIPCGRRIVDTMLQQHRCFPETEKSLGHCVSMWTYEPYHKDEGIFMPNNLHQEEQLWRYNGKDISTMRMVNEAQLEYAKTQRGLQQSFNQVNSSIRPYLINTLTGIRFDNDKRLHIMDENDRLMMQYMKWINKLCGYEMSPASPQQCVEYFHNQLHYDIVERTPQNAPSLRGEAFQKLKLKYPNNPVIDICLAYRSLKKQTGSLKFEPWKQ